MIGRIFIAIVICLDYSNCLDLCGDWTQYKDIKCIKVLEKKVTEEEALNTCTKLDQSSILLTIHSKDEQDYLNALLEKYHNISLNVWLGMKYTDKAFRWMDGTVTDYTNWSEDAVKDGSTQCAEMSLQKETFGKWVDVSCLKTSLIVCQKKQEFNLNILKNALDNMTKVIENQQNQIKTQENKINSLIPMQNQFNSLIPIGFLYTQLPNQSSPQELWPNMKWSEVTKEYSGLFFRAEGGESLPFGQIQPANQSELSNVNLYGCHYSSWSGQHCDTKNTPINRGGNEIAGLSYPRAVAYMQLHITSGEIRPKNTAIKIFKRIK